jgi:hypothetical protein
VTRQRRDGDATGACSAAARGGREACDDGKEPGRGGSGIGPCRTALLQIESVALWERWTPACAGVTKG